jgi:proteasome accessory factor C
MDGRSYLEAWCRSAEGMRVFRVDRMEHLVQLDEPSRPPADVQLRDLAEGVYQPASEHLLAILRLSPAYFWVADYYPVDSVEDLPDGRLLVVLRAADTRWLRTLVLRQAGAARVLEPDDLRKAVHDRASAALAAYA